MFPKGLQKYIKKVYILCILFGLFFSFPTSLIYAQNKVGFFSPGDQFDIIASSTVNIPVQYTDPREGDLMLAIIVTRPLNTTPLVITPPVGWTFLGSYEGTDGLPIGSDAGPVTINAYYTIADGTEGKTFASFATSGGRHNPALTHMYQIRSATGTYDLSMGGFSINGDTTNLGGPLDSNIGLTAGDLVFLVSAINTDSPSFTGQGISAAGITSTSVIRERVETRTSGGIDAGVAVSVGQIFAGTSTDIPNVTTTLNAAASGATAAIRIRQGAGVERSDTWVFSAGPIAIGSTSLTIPYPEFNIGDIMVLLVSSKHGANPPNTPGGWTSLGSYVGGLGTAGIDDQGPIRVSAFYRVLNSFLTGTFSVSIPGGNSSIGQVLTLHKDDVTSWLLDTDGGVDDVADTQWLTTGNNGIDTSNILGGDVILTLSGKNTDAFSYSNHVLSSPGVTFGETTQTSFRIITTGTDSAFEVLTSRIVDTINSLSTLTVEAVANNSSTFSPTGPSMFIKILGLGGSVINQSAFRFFENLDSLDVGNPLASQDTSANLIGVGDSFRLRILLNVSMEDLSLSSGDFKLQFAEKVGSCDSGFSGENYIDVGTATDISFVNNPSVFDGQALTVNANDPINGLNVIVNQTYEESNNFSNSDSAILNGQDGKWDFALFDNGAPANTSFCFRVIKADGSLLDNYDIVPEITTAAMASQNISMTISDNSIGFGSLSPSSARYATGDTLGSGTDSSDAHTITASTNASGGYILTVNGTSLTCNACGGETIDPIGGVSTVSSPGTEQFGIRAIVNSGTGTVSVPYNQASEFAFDTAAFPDLLATGLGDNNSTTYGLRYLGNITSSTEAGAYVGVLTYTITASY